MEISPEMLTYSPEMRESHFELPAQTPMSFLLYFTPTASRNCITTDPEMPYVLPLVEKANINRLFAPHTASPHSTQAAGNRSVPVGEPLVADPHPDWTTSVTSLRDLFFEPARFYNVGSDGIPPKQTRTTVTTNPPLSIALNGTRGRTIALTTYLRASEFLDRVYALSSTDLRDATDAIFQFIDSQLCEGDFIVCREILRRADISRLPTALMRSFLTITFAAKHQLPERRTFYDLAFSEMVRQRGSVNAHRLLDALK